MSNATMEVKPSVDGWVTLVVRCKLCSHVEFTGRRRDVVPTADEVLADHLAQHEPGRALDIEVDWEPSANCSVCPDGIGTIKHSDDGGITCTECGTEWDLDGGGGVTL